MAERFNREKVLEILDKILQSELAGVVRYTHYSFMVYGFNRIPIVKWLREQAEEALNHAHGVGELITALGGHPSLGIGPLLETYKHDIGDILRESMEHEQEALKLYYELLKEVEGKSVLLEDFARKMIVEEEEHLSEVDKMLRKSGTTERFSQPS